MNAHHPLKAALRRLRSGKAEAESCAVIKTLLARIRAALTLDEVLMEGFPGIKTLDDDQALEYWTGKASKHGRGNLQEDDLDVGSLVMIKGVAPDTTGGMRPAPSGWGILPGFWPSNCHLCCWKWPTTGLSHPAPSASISGWWP